jgi:hypothetical protein
VSRGRDSWGNTANTAVGELAARVDTQTADVAQRAASVLVFAVRVLRWPSLLILVSAIPFELITLGLGLRAEGLVRVLGLAMFLALAAVSTAFGLRRFRIMRAASDRQALGTELGIAASLSDRVDEARGVLVDVVGGGGWRIFGRLRGLWSGVGLTARWIDEVGDLPRARYFVPPKIGTTVTLTFAALWLVPVSAVFAVLIAIASVARAF